MNSKEFFSQKDKSGKYTNEKYIKNNYPEHYEVVLNFAKIFNLDLPFKQKVYHFVNDIHEKVKCKLCDNEVKFKNSTLGYYSYCSPSCVGKDSDIQTKKEKKSLEKFGTKTPAESDIVKNKMIKTNMEKYGSKSPLGNEEIQKKSKETLFKNYEVEHPSLSKEIQEKRVETFKENIDQWKEKFEKTMLERYGTTSALQNEEIKNKMKQTNIEKYGVENPLQNEEIKNKMVNTVKEKYNTDCVLKNKEIKEKSDKTNIEKYSVDNVFKSKIFQDKIKITNLEKYGVEHVLQNDKIKEKMLENLKRTYNDKILEKYNATNYSFDNKELTIFCEKCGKKYNIRFDLLHNRIDNKIEICTNCNPVGSRYGKQLQLTKFIEENYNKEILIGKRQIINPLELDIYLPDVKLSFEFNGIYWHSELNKLDNYHQIKTDLCLEKDIQLIHVWEDDWDNKQEIVKSIILKKLKKSNTISSKDCEIKEINETDQFLIENNLESPIKSDINIGLFYIDEQFGLMCLNKVDDSYHITRFCYKNYTFVDNGFETMLKFFIEKYKPNKISSCVDRSYFSGQSYLDFGFVLSDIEENIIEKCYSKHLYNVHTPGNLKFIKSF